VIRRLKSSEYRLYSRKVDPKTHKRKNLGRSNHAKRLRSTSARCNISSIMFEVKRPRSDARRHDAREMGALRTAFVVSG